MKPDGWARDVRVLRGDDHPDLGTLGSVRLDDRCGLALSAGGYPALRAKLDRNEDAVAAVSGTTGYLLVVADGHRGFDAAGAAVDAIIAAVSAAPAAAAEDPDAFVEALVTAGRRGVTEALARTTDRRQASRTALTVALVTDRGLLEATFGDTAVCQVGRRRRLLRRARHRPHQDFLGPDSTLPSVRRHRLDVAAPVLAASDGLIDFLGGDWRADAAELIRATGDPEEAARTLVEAACGFGAGDNVSVAVLFGPHRST